MMKQSNWSFKLLVFSNLALLVILLFTFFSGSDKVDVAKDTPKTGIPVEPASTLSGSEGAPSESEGAPSVVGPTGPANTPGNVAEVCGEHSYENHPIMVNYDVDHTGKNIGDLNSEVICSLRWHLAKFYKSAVSKKNPKVNFYTLGRKIDAQGNPTDSLVERFDIRNSNNLIAPPTERVDVSWCSQTLQGLNRKASWEFAVHACMLLYKRIYLEVITRQFEEDLISESNYRETERLLARQGSKDVDWHPKTYWYRMDFSDLDLLYIEWYPN